MNYIPGFSQHLQQFARGGPARYAGEDLYDAEGFNQPMMFDADQQYVAPYVNPYQYVPDEQPYVAPYVAPIKQPYVPGFTNYLEASIPPYVAPAEAAAPYAEPYQPTPTAQPMTQEPAPAAGGLSYEDREARRIAANTPPPGTSIVGPYAGKKGLSFGDDNTFDIYDEQEVRVVDGKGNVIFSGVGVDGANRAVAVAQSLSNDLGKNANFRIQKGENTIKDGIIGPNRYIDVAYAAPSQSGLGFLADTVLPFAATFIPGVGPVLGAALGSAASSAAQGRGLEDALKRAAIAGGSAYVGGQVFGPASSTAGSTAGSVAGSTAGSAAGSVADDVINVIGPNLVGSTLGSTIGSGLSSVTGYKTPAEKFAEQPLPEAFQPPVDPYAGIDPIVVSGGTTAAPNVGGALSGVFEPIATDFLPKGGLPEPLPSEPTPTETTPVEEIVVTAPRTVTPDIPFSAVLPTLPNLIPPLSDPALMQPDVLPDDIVVNAPKAVTPDVPFEAVLPSLPALIPPLSDPALMPPDVLPDDIVVEGSKIERPEPVPVTVMPPVGPVAEVLPPMKADPALTDAKKKLGVEDYLSIAGKILPLLGAGGGSGQTGTYGGGGTGRLNPIFSAKLPSAGGLGTIGATRTARPLGDEDWLTYGTRPELNFFDYASQNNPAPITTPIPNNPAGPAMYAPDVDNMRFAKGGRSTFAVNGPGTGRSDDIPAVLSDGEYVIDAETVALLGDGSNKAGAKKLDDLRVKVRKHKGQKLAKGRFSANAKKAEAYLSGGRI